MSAIPAIACTAAQKAVLADRLVTIYVDHIRNFSLVQLNHEAERNESLPPSPVCSRIRAALTDEIARRAGVLA